MNRLNQDLQSASRGEASREPTPSLEPSQLQWVQSICEQLGDGYLVFSRWQCLGLGGRLWRARDSRGLDRSSAEDWLGVFHESDHGAVALGLADPTVNTFPSVSVIDRRTGQYRRARLRMFYPPFDAPDGMFVVVVQLDSGEPAAADLNPVAPAEEAFHRSGAEMLIVELATGRIDAVNDAFLQGNRLERARVEGASFFDLPVIDNEVARILLGTLELGGQVQHRPVTLVPEGSEVREMFVDVTPLQAAGKTRLAVVYFVDVTLHNSATRHLSSILNHLPVGVFTKSPEDGRYLLSNAAADAYLAGGKSLRGLTDAEILPADLADDFAEADAKVRAHRRAVEANEVYLERPGERPRLFQILRVPVNDSRGQLSRILGMIREVTADVRSRESLLEAKNMADRANRAKDEFLVNMGHEIRTPMNAILGFLNLLTDTVLDDEQTELLETVQNSCESLGRVIDAILDLSRVAGGAMELEKQEFDLEGLCEELVESFVESARRKGLELRLMLDPSTPARIHGDPFRLRQLLGNLVGNAIKFTGRGLVEVSVEAIEVGPSTASLRFAVADTGIGVEPAKQGMIFEPFTQADSSETRAYEGTGLGLTLSQRLAEAMGSRIELESQVGVGSTFSLVLQVPHDGCGSIAELEPCPKSGNLVILARHSERGASIGRPLRLWGMATTVANGFEEFVRRIDDEGKCDFAVIEWSALTEAQQERLIEVAQRVPCVQRWIVAISESEDSRSLDTRAPGVRQIESVLRSSLLRSAIVEASEARATQSRPQSGMEEAAPVVPVRNVATPEGRVLVIDDNSLHRRQFASMLRDRHWIVDSCGSEHEGLHHARLHSYSYVFFEGSFIGEETARMIVGLRNSFNSDCVPTFVGIAYSRDEARERELQRAGVHHFLSKPIIPAVLDKFLAETRRR